MKSLRFSLFMVIILLQLTCIFLGLQMFCSCKLPTGDALCTQKCNADYTAPIGKEIFGIHDGEDMKGALLCSCYARKLR